MWNTTSTKKPTQQRVLQVRLIVILGLITRLLIMPFTLHHDLLSTARRSTLLLNHNTFLLPYVGEVVYTALLYPLKPFVGTLTPTLVTKYSYEFSVIPGKVAYHKFISAPNRFSTLFYLKLPFLITDVMLLYLVSKYMNSYLRNYIFWAFNPFVLYGVYMWGRYEIFPIYLTTLALILLGDARDGTHKRTALLFITLAVICRVPFVLFLPITALYISSDWRGLLKNLLVPLAVLFTTNRMVTLYGGGNNIDQYLEIGLTARIGEGFNATSPFLIACAVILFLSARDKMEGELSYYRFISYNAFVLLAYFSLTVFHPQYLAWITPIATVLINMNRKFLPPLMVLLSPFLLLADVFYGCYACVCLFTEVINVDFGQSIQTVNGLLMGKLSNMSLISVYHTIFVLIIFYIVYLIKKHIYAR